VPGIGLTARKGVKFHTAVKTQAYFDPRDLGEPFGQHEVEQKCRVSSDTRLTVYRAFSSASLGVVGSY
jgi:hypothetical protein